MLVIFIVLYKQKYLYRLLIKNNLIMDKKLAVYELVISDENTEGIRAMSLVDEPAVEKDFLMFNKQEKIEFKIESEEKRIITGIALIPDKQIYRYNPKTDKEYNVFFSKETIEKLAYNFLLDNKQNNITLQHQVNGNGVKLIESWLSKNDNELEMGAPVGTWFVSYKVFNDEIWEDVKNGEFNGFSIEVFTTRVETDLSMDEKVIEVKDEIESYLDKEVNDLTEEELSNLIKNIGDIINPIKKEEK